MPQFQLENNVLKHIFNVLKSRFTLVISSSTSFVATINDGQVTFQAILDTSGQLTNVFITDLNGKLDVKRYFNDFNASKESAESDVNLLTSLSIARHYYNQSPIESVIAVQELKNGFASISGFVSYVFVNLQFNGPYFDFNYMIGGYQIVIRLIQGDLAYQIQPLIDGEIANDIRQKIYIDCTNVQNYLNSIF